MRNVQATGKLGVKESRIFLKKGTRHGRRQCSENQVLCSFSIGGGAKRETEAGHGSCGVAKTASMEQVTNLMRELKQQDVCDMEVDLAEVMWQEADASLWSTLAHEVVECLPGEEEGVEDIDMASGERRDESEGEGQAPMEDEEQRDGSVAEQEVHSKQDLERVKKALTKLHTNLGHPGVKEMVRVLKHGRASELAIQKERRMHCCVCAENVQPKLLRQAIPRLQRTARFGHFEFTSLGRFHKISEMLEHRVSRHSFPDDRTTVVGYDGSGSETSIPRRLAAVGT